MHLGPDDMAETFFGRGRCLVVGEVAQAHDGSLGMAHAFIDAIADAGADVVKFQTHIAAEESTLREPWRVRFSTQDATRFDYWKRMEFSEAQWRELKSHTEERGLLFVSSPFSVQAVEWLRRLGCRLWKVASGETTHPLLIDEVLASGGAVIASTGMSGWAEIDDLVGRLRLAGNEFAVLQCTTAYPCPPEDIGLNVMQAMRERYGCPVGLSDHSATIFPGLAAAALGAEVVEVHVTLSREMFGPDVGSSVTTGELRQLVRGVRFIETMLGNPVDKDLAAGRVSESKRIFGRSLVAARALTAGTTIARHDIAAKKPGDGLPASRLGEILGRRLRRDVPADHPFSEDDFA